MLRVAFAMIGVFVLCVGTAGAAAPVIDQGGPLSVTMSEDGAPTTWSAPTLSATDADMGDTLTWSVSSAASNGVATVSGTGASPSTFTYEPDADWSGSDSFEVQVSDGNGGADAITVNVTVEPVNDAPVLQSAPDAYVFSTKWGSVGAGNGQFDLPSGVAVDASGNVYVADTDNYRIQKFDSSGNYLTQWGSYGSGDGRFESPFGVAVDASSNVYVTDLSIDRIQKFDSSGNYLSQWGGEGSGDGQFQNPRGVALDTSGNVYVADTGNNRIQKFDSSGNYVTQWGGSGSGDGQFSFPSGVAADPSGNVYVADRNNYRIQKFDSSGAYLTQWGGNGSGNGQFSLPYGVAVDASGNVYVADTYNERIQNFDSSGNYVTHWGGFGSGDGQFSHPFGVAVDASGNVYVAENLNYRIQKFVWTPGTPVGASVAVTMDEDASPRAFDLTLSASDPDGDTLTWSISITASNGTAEVSGTGESKAISYTPDTNYVGSDSFEVRVADPSGATDTVTVNVTVEAVNDAVTIDQAGPLSVTMSEDGAPTAWSAPTLTATDPDTGDTVTWSVSSAASHGTATVSGTGTSPTTFTYAPDADWYGSDSFEVQVSDATVTDAITVNVMVEAVNDAPILLRVDGSGSGYVYETQWGSFGSGDGEFTQAIGVAIDAMDNVYVSDSSNSRIQKFDADGAYLLQWGSAGAGDGQFDNPAGLAVDASNRIYVVDTGNNRIQKFDSNGLFLGQWGSAGSGDGEFDGPSDISIDAASVVYVVDCLNDRVQHFDLEGLFLGQWSGVGSGDGEFDNPIGVACAEDGSIFISDSGNSWIQQFDSSGVFLNKFGSAGVEAGQFSFPAMLAMDEWGYVIVPEFNGNRVQRFDATGAYIMAFGSAGSGDGQFNHPMALAVNSAGKVYVADSLNARVQRFRYEGDVPARDSVAVTMSEDATPNAFDLSLYATDPEGDTPLTWTISSAASHGTAGVTDGVVSYTPTANYVGSDSFEVQVADPSGATDTVTVNVTIEAQQDAVTIDQTGPLAVTMSEDGAPTAWLAPTLSASDPDTGDTLTWSVSSAASHGTATVSGTGTSPATFTYAPDEDWSGVDSFEVQVSDATVTDAITVNVTVEGVNDAPTLGWAPSTLERKWGSLGTGDGEFTNPTGIAVDSANNVYVVDYGNNRIQKFDSSGAYLMQWGASGAGDGQFSSPYAIAVDSSGLIYVADTGNNRIQKFDSSGAYLLQWGASGAGDGQFNFPIGIAVDSSGAVYVADAGNDRVQKFDASGAYLSQWGSSGTGDGQFSTPNGLVVDSGGAVYVTDKNACRVQKFDSSGAYLSQWGSMGQADGEFNLPFGVAVDSLGVVYIADYSNHRVQKFDPDGAFLAKWGSYGTENGQFNYPEGVAVDSTGAVYVSERNNHRIQKFFPEILGASIDLTMSEDGTPTAFNLTLSASDPEGDTPLTWSISSVASHGTAGVTDGVVSYVPETNYVGSDSFEVQVADPSGATDTVTVNVTIEAQQDAVTIDQTGPLSVTMSEDGAPTAWAAPTLTATDPDAGDTLTWRLRSNAVHGTAIFGGTGVSPSYFEYVPHADWSGSDSFIGEVIDGNGGVDTITINVTVEPFNDAPTVKYTSPVFNRKWGVNGSGDGEFNHPYGVCVDSSDSIYVADQSNHRIQRFVSDGSYVFQWGSQGTGDGQFNYPIAVASDGLFEIYVVDADNDRIQKFDNAGGYLLQWGGSGSGDGQFNYPKDIAVDSSGNVYVADPYNHRIQKFDGDGNYILQWGTAGTGNGQFDEANCIAVDAADAVYVADTNNHRVQKFDSNGNYLQQWGSLGSGEGQFNYPLGIASDKFGSVYVVDALNYRIQKFDASGAYLAQFGDSSAGDGGFVSPYGIAVDSAGDIYVSDTMRHRIQKFSSNIFGGICGVQMSEDGVPTPFELSLSAYDIEGDAPLTWSISGTPTHGIADVVDGVVSYSPAANYEGTDTFYLQVADPHDAVTTVEVYVIIGAVNDGPSIDQTGPLSVTMSEDGAPTAWLAPTLTATDLDAGDTLTWRLGSDASHGVATVSGIGASPSTFNYVPEADWSGSDSFEVQVADGLGISDTITVNVTVEVSNDPPIIRLSEIAFEMAWGSGGTGDSQFDLPFGIDLDSAGNVYVADTNNYRVQKFDSSGAYLSQWGGLGSFEGQFGNPRGLVIDAADNVYVVDRDNHRVQKFDSTGAYLSQWGGRGSANGQFDMPYCITLDSDGNFYVSDAGNHRVQKFDSDFNYLSQFGTEGANEGEFNEIRGLAVDASGNIYVSDIYSHRIHKFDASGAFLLAWGSNGSDPGQFIYPYGLALDPYGKLYVADELNDRVQIFDESGLYLSEFGTSGTGDGQFDSPLALAIDSDAAVYVTDAGHRVQKFSYMSVGASIPVTMSEDGTPTPFSLSLSASDPENDVPLTWSITSAASHGTAGVTDGIVSYTPTPNYDGSDSFEVQVADPDGLSDAVIVEVTIEGVNDGPALSLLGEAILTLECGASYTDAGATATDPEEGDISEDIVVGGDTVDSATPGSYTLTYDVQDAQGLAATQLTRTVTVSDTTAPVLSLTGDAAVTLECGASYSDVGATATDACEGDLSASIVVGGDTVDTATPGSYTITYDVSDAAGNAATQVTRTVTVSDTTAPVISLTGDVAVSVECDSSYSDAGATATDVCDGDLSASVLVGGDTVDTTTPGSYTLSYDVSDAAGNAATQVTRTVTVADTTAPVISLTGDVAVSVECGASYSDAGATATDVCDGDLSAGVLVGGDTVDTATPGSYTITYDVSDAAGNAATQVTRTVTVADTTGPVLSLTGDASVMLDCGAVYSEEGATASDACEGDLSVSVIVGGDTVDTSAPGEFTVTYAVSDAAGNAAVSLSRTVIVDGSSCGEGELPNPDEAAFAQEADLYQYPLPQNPGMPIQIGDQEEELDRILDNFWGLRAPIYRVAWYGMEYRELEDGAIEGCAPAAYRITLYEEDNGAPGAAVHTTLANPEYERISYETPLYLYQIYLDDLVDLEAGWISIQATREDGCLSYWLQALESEGDDLKYLRVWDGAKSLEAKSDLYVDLPQNGDMSFFLFSYAAEEGELLPDTCAADVDGDNYINLSELLRVIQFFNSAGYHCEDSANPTEDGYEPGPDESAQLCLPHTSDYNPQDWVIDLSEMLRLIQFYNSDGYHRCDDYASEDGYCPGL